MVGELEQELKFEFTDRVAWDRALEALGPPSSRLEQVNHYFSDAAGSSGWSLRLRRENGNYRLTYKSGRSAQDGYFQALEVEECVDSPSAEKFFAGLASDDPLWSLPPLARLRADRGVSQLIYLGCNRNQRFPCPQEGWVAELDISEFPDGSIDYELEVECSDPASVREQLQRMLGALTVQTKTKYRRFLERRVH